MGRRLTQKNRTPPEFVLVLWPLIDWLLRAIHHIRPPRADGGSIISLELRRYDGPALTLHDGCKIKAGDRIIELHMNGLWFKQRRKLDVKAARLPWEILHSVKHELRFLAEQITRGAFDKITALHGVTFGGTFLDMGARRLGFQVKELPNSLWKKWAQFYMAGLMQTYHLRAREGFKVSDKPLELKEIWLSRTELLRRYGPGHP